MGIKCSKCKSTNTQASSPGKMMCFNCSHEWIPYKHRGKKMRIIGDGFITQRRKIMPGAKTKVIGDGILFKKRRIKKQKIRSIGFGF